MEDNTINMCYQQSKSLIGNQTPWKTRKSKM